MNPKLNIYPNGSVSMEQLFPSGMYLVQGYKGTELFDKVRCDDKKMAMDYFRSFCKIAKNA